MPNNNNRDNTASLMIPDDTNQDCTLSPLTRCGYRVFEPDGERIFSDSQKRDLQRFLTANGQQKIPFILLSVPIIHLPKLLAKLVARLPPPNEDFSDRWSSGDHIRDRDWVLKTLLRHQNSHPRQRLVLLSADIHFLIFNHQNDRPVCVYRSEWV